MTKKNSELLQVLEETQIDLEVHKEEDQKLAEELAECNHKLLKMETFLDVEKVAFKLQTLEMDNFNLKNQNTRFMDELFKQKKENQRIKIIEEHFRLKQEEVYTLDKTNNLLVEKLKKAKKTNDHMREVNNGRKANTMQRNMVEYSGQRDSTGYRATEGIKGTRSKFGQGMFIRYRDRFWGF